jgi:putative ABC transport system permease protein
MLSNFFKTALRNIFRHKTYVIINILGLAVSFACSLLIFLFVIHELSYDKFNEKYDRIYRLYLVGKMGESEFKGSWTAAPTAKAFIDEFPEVESAVRMDSWGESLIRIDDRKFIEDKIALADSSFFDVFSLKLLKGNPHKALSQPNSVVLTTSEARKYFGDNEPMGQYLRIGNDTALYTITGVMEDVPENCHFDFNLLISFLTHPRAKDDFWLSNSFATYILLREGSSGKSVESKIPKIIEKYVGPQVEKVLGMDLKSFLEAGNKYGIYMQPLSDIHLNPDIASNFKQARDRKYIYIFSGIAFLIIVVAGINYMNLSTARSTKRSREVGMRKVVGSTRGLLIRQFILESIILTLISLFIAIILVEVLLPVFNNFLETDMKVGYFSRWYVIPGILVLALLVGFLSGSYPAWFLASFVPVKALYSKLKLGSTNIRFRSVLVVLQFVISIWLIMSSFVIYKQIKFMIHKDLGFDKEQLLVIRRTDGLNKKIKSFKEEVRKIPSVINIANSTAVPGYPNNNNGFLMEGQPAEKPFLMWVNWVDYDYLSTYKIKLADGRDFNREYASDSTAVIINQEAVRRFGLTDPFNVRFIQPGRTPQEKKHFNVIGVSKNFHLASLRSEIEPHVFIIKPDKWDWAGYITIRMDKDNVKKTIAQIESVWRSFTNDEPFQYFFLDKEFETFYKEEKQTARIAVAFSILAILIASLGLFGLTSFATEQRAREISLRKVLGSSVNSIMLLFSKEFSLLVLIAAVPAGLLSYYSMNTWLHNFKYHISVGYGEFLLALGIVLFVAFLTVSIRTYRAAQTNPAEVLKYE